VQADLKTFAALRVHGTSAVTCLTAQNPRGVRAVQAATPAMLRAQMEAVFDELPPAACKTGMLFATPLIRVVAEFFKPHNRPPLVVDPVMLATSGARLLSPGAEKILQRELLPRAVLVTPNLGEAERLLSTRLRSMEDLRRAARMLHERFGCAALVKGGHLRGGHEAADIFFDGQTELLLSVPFVRGVSTHGTGCTFSAAITACVARGLGLAQAVSKAKEFITQAITHSIRAGRHDVLNPFA
jgi:hydroxymethylpyrimidine/phosphomethylpyrimidine kinase